MFRFVVVQRHSLERQHQQLEGRSADRTDCSVFGHRAAGQSDHCVQRTDLRSAGTADARPTRLESGRMILCLGYVIYNDYND